jgi:hypothetical protein
LAKAERGELALGLPIGLMRDPSRIVIKDPDLAVQERIGLVFQTFLKVRTVAKVMRVLNDRGLDLPRRAATDTASHAGRERRSPQWRRF